MSEIILKGDKNNEQEITVHSPNTILNINVKKGEINLIRIAPNLVFDSPIVLTENSMETYEKVAGMTFKFSSDNSYKVICTLK